MEPNKHCLLNQILKDATTFFSRSAANLATVIPVMDHIDEYFTIQLLNEEISPAARLSITIAKQTLNQYYELTDSSDVYQIAMGKSVGFSFCMRPTLILPYSPAPPSQAYLFSECPLAARVGRHRQKPGLGHIRPKVSTTQIAQRRCQCE